MMSHSGKSGSRWVSMMCIVAILMSGCHRSYYRQQADADAYARIEEKSANSQWRLPNSSIEVDPQSRMYDPFNIDCPPMPPDDPASNEFMRYVGGQRAWDGWENNGVLTEVENPRWRSMLPLSDDNTLKLNMDTAVRMALIHAPEFQNELEDLYLSALDVSFERFQFDVQYFAGKSGFFEFAGKDSPRGDSSTSFGFSTSSQAGGNSWQKRRLFATGAQLVVGLANSLIWEFSGPDDHTALTLLDFSIVQPLLRGGGRDIVLENLTQTERTLLANVRQMERFRRAFYVEVATGRGANDGPNRGGPNLVGFTNTGGGAGGFLGLVQTSQDIRNQRSNIAALQSSVSQLQAFFEAGRIDFFQVEFARQALFSAQSRLLGTERGLQQALDSFKVTLGLPPDIDVELEDDIIAPFQLVDPEIIPLQNSLTLLQQKAGQTMSRLFATAVEPALEKNRKRQAEAEESTEDEENSEKEGDSKTAADAETDADSDDLADDLGEDIEFDSDEDTDDVDRTTDELPDIDVLNKDASDESQDARPFFDDAEEPQPPTLEWSPSVEKELGNLLDQLQQSLRLLKKARDSHLDGASEDIERLKSALKPRGRIAKLLKKQIRERLEKSRGNNGDEVTEDDIAALLPYDSEELEELPDALSRTMTQVREELGASEERITKLAEDIEALLETGEELTPEKLYEEIQTKLRTTVPDELNEFSATVLSITLVQARARTESATLPTIELKWNQAVEQARTNRLDWMNARAQLVDTWRTIQFTARDLESQLDVSLSGGIGNVGDNPLDIRWDSGQIRFGIEFDAPITRLAERNVYRQSLIDYQRARRNFYRFEDGVAVSLRDIIRRLEINQINFELQRAAVEVAISQVELSRLRLQEPPRPNETGGLGVNTARDLVSALQGLLGAQNDFLNVWINQEALRRFLDLDMGTMQLDETGMWIDPGPSLGQNANETFDVMAIPAGSSGMIQAPLDFEAPMDPNQQPPEFQMPQDVEAMEFAPDPQPQFEREQPFEIDLTTGDRKSPGKQTVIRSAKRSPKPKATVRRYATPVLFVPQSTGDKISVDRNSIVATDEPPLFKIRASDLELIPIHSNAVHHNKTRVRTTNVEEQDGLPPIRNPAEIEQVSYQETEEKSVKSQGKVIRIQAGTPAKKAGSATMRWKERP